MMNRRLSCTRSLMSCTVLLLLGLCATYSCAQPLNRRPEDIEMLFRNFVVEYIALRPETGTYLGIPVNWGIEANNSELDDISDEAEGKIYELYRKYHNWIDQYDRKQLSPSQRIAADVFKWLLENELRGEKFRYHRYVINPMFGFHNQFVTLMTEHHKIETLQDAEDYIARLSKVNKKIDGMLEQLLIRQSKGIIPPLHIVEKYQQKLSDFVQPSLSNNILLTSYIERINGLPEMNNDLRQRLRQKTLDALESSVYPSYKKLINHLATLKDKTNGDAGVCRLPQGAEYYQFCLNEHTTTSMTPEQVHNLGQQEVKRIKDEIREQFKKLGISGSNSFTDLMAQYVQLTGNRFDRRFFFSLAKEGKEQTLQAYQAIIDTMQMRLPEMFERIPRASVIVRRVPEYKEDVTSNYYRPPKLDGSEGGVFFADLSYQHSIPGMKALAYHEAIPGHHLQIALEQELPDVRLFKALFFFTGYVEGWALYAERLAKEYEFYSDTYSLIEYLRSELFRAARLVVDTGIHSMNWTRDRAYRYMLSNVGWSSYNQIDRYIVWPGQACAYKIGELKILELRERAKRALGDRFDLKKFHKVILKHGSVPLDVLEQLVDEYIESTTG